LFGYFIFGKQNKVTSRRAAPGIKSNMRQAHSTPMHRAPAEPENISFDFFGSSFPFS